MTEKSFADRLGRGKNLKDACAGFTPAFAPADTQLTVVNFNTFLTSVEAKNTAVGDAEAMYTVLALERVDHVKTIKKRCTEAVNHVESNSAWVTVAKAVKKPAQKLRGFTPKAPAPPEAPPEGTDPESAPRNAGDQSYEDIAGHLQKFITALEQVPGYAPVNVEITIGAFNGLLSTLRGQNTGLSALGQSITLTKMQRQSLYYGETGLRLKMKFVKKAVRSQYGSDSPQFQAVDGISF